MGENGSLKNHKKMPNICGRPCLLMLPRLSYFDMLYQCWKGDFLGYVWTGKEASGASAESCGKET